MPKPKVSRAEKLRARLFTSSPPMRPTSPPRTVFPFRDHPRGHATRRDSNPKRVESSKGAHGSAPGSSRDAAWPRHAPGFEPEARERRDARGAHFCKTRARVAGGGYPPPAPPPPTHHADNNRPRETAQRAPTTGQRLQPVGRRTRRGAGGEGENSRPRTSATMVDAHARREVVGLDARASRVGGRRAGVRPDRKRPFSARASTISTRQALRVMTNGTRTGWRRPCARRGGQYGPVKNRDVTSIGRAGHFLDERSNPTIGLNNKIYPFLPGCAQDSRLLKQFISRDDRRSTRKCLQVHGGSSRPPAAR